MGASAAVAISTPLALLLAVSQRRTGCLAPVFCLRSSSLCRRGFVCLMSRSFWADRVTVTRSIPNKAHTGAEPVVATANLNIVPIRGGKAEAGRFDESTIGEEVDKRIPVIEAAVKQGDPRR